MSRADFSVMNELEKNARAAERTYGQLTESERAAERPEPGTTICDGCGKDIDPDCCGCGDSREGHGNPMDAGHPFIPAGCDCYRSDR